MSLAAAYVLGTRVQSPMAPRDCDPRFDGEESPRLRRTVEEELRLLQTHADRFTPELESLYDAERWPSMRRQTMRFTGAALALVFVLTLLELASANREAQATLPFARALLAAPLAPLLAIQWKAAVARTVDLATVATLVFQLVIVGWTVLGDGTPGWIVDPHALEMALVLGGASLAGLPRPLAGLVVVVGLVLSAAFGFSASGSPWHGAQIGVALAALTLLAELVRYRIDRAARESFLTRLRLELQLRQSEDDRAAMEQLSRLDPLTGIANRRAFDMELAATTSRADAMGDAVLLALVDVDHFKAFNDREGHLVGDECLRRVAAVLRARRGDGFVARYGGEEFAMVLSGPDRAVLEGRIDTLCEAVAALRTSHQGRSDGIDHITVSIGGAFAAPGKAGSDVIARADAALYRAKAAGRNCRVMDGDAAQTASRALREVIEPGLAGRPGAEPMAQRKPVASRRRAR